LYFEELVRPTISNIPDRGDLLANLAPNTEIGPKDFLR